MDFLQLHVSCAASPNVNDTENNKLIFKKRSMQTKRRESCFNLNDASQLTASFAPAAAGGRTKSSIENEI